MIAGVFRSNQLLFSYGLSVVLALVIVLFQAFTGTTPQALAEGEHLLMQSIRSLPQPVLLVIHTLLLGGGAILFNQLLVNEKISRDYNSLFLLGYIMAASSYSGWRYLSGAAISGFLLLVVMRNLMIAGNSKRQLSLVFDAGFLGGLAYLLYEPAWVILPMSFLGIVLGGFFRFKALMIWLFGYITPVYLFASVAYLSDQQAWLLDLVPHFNREAWYVLQLNWTDKVLLAFSLAVWLMGVLVSFTGVNLKTNALRNAQRLFFIFLLCVVPALWFLPADGWMMAALFVPVSAFYMGRFLESVPGRGLFNLLIVVWLALLALPFLPI